MGKKSFSDLRTDIGRLGHWNLSQEGSPSYLAATAAAEAGLRAIHNLGAFDWMEREGEIDLSELVSGYQQAEPDLVVAYKMQSFNYGAGRGSELLPRSKEWIDRKLGPQWRTASNQDGTPRYVTVRGGNIWIARKPSASFIAAYPTIYYDYLVGEDITADTLNLPDQFYESAIVAGLSLHLKHKDDSERRSFLDEWNNVHKPMLLGSDRLINGYDYFEGTTLSDDLQGDAYAEQGYY